MDKIISLLLLNSTIVAAWVLSTKASTISEEERETIQEIYVQLIDLMKDVALLRKEVKDDEIH